MEVALGRTTFDIHIYDCEPKEYAALREMLNHYLRSKFEEDPLGRKGN